jgi:hypothetical protein
VHLIIYGRWEQYQAFIFKNYLLPDGIQFTPFSRPIGGALKKLKML